jgi:Tfp pilus assembly protein PilF
MNSNKPSQRDAANRWLAAWTGILMIAIPAFSQAPPAGGGAGAGSTGGGNQGGGAGAGRIPTTPSPTQPGQGRFPEQNRFPEMARPIYLSGKVVLDDGTAPPDSVTIERVCNGQPRPEAYTDSKGRFSFQLGQNNGMMADASYGSGNDGFGSNDPFNRGGNTSQNAGFGGMPGQRQISERDLIGCELRAVLPGFRSDVVNLSGRRSMDNPDVGTIVLHRLANVEGTTISAIAMQAPKDAKKAFEKGHNNLTKKKLDDAVKEFEKAISIYPKYTTAYYELGRALEAQDKKEDARRAYNQAVEIDPKYVSPYRQLAGMSAREQKWKETAEYSQKVIKLDPIDYPDAFFYNAVANYYLKNYDEAESSARDALKLDSGHRIPKSAQLLGMILIEKQDYAGAAEQMKGYLKLLPPGNKDAEYTQKQIAELERAIAAKGNQ